MRATEIQLIILGYATESKSIIDATCDLLRLLQGSQSARQVQIARDYFEEILTQVKYEGLPIDLAVTGVAEAVSASFS